MRSVATVMMKLIDFSLEFVIRNFNQDKTIPVKNEILNRHFKQVFFLAYLGKELTHFFEFIDQTVTRTPLPVFFFCLYTFQVVNQLLLLSTKEVV
jgi:hypothetical protein